MTTVACVKYGEKYGPEYVNRLYAGLCAHISPSVQAAFVCFTDDPSGLRPEIETRPLPEGLSHWWNKLALFKPGAFPEGERVIYIDLDTVIIADVDFLFSDGIPDDAIVGLADPFETGVWCSGFMSWRSGMLDGVWTAYEEEGRPGDDVYDTGDQEFTRTHCAVPVAFAQDLWPGKFASYKAHCGEGAPPRDAAIVYFHGFPKPKDVADEWVGMAWSDAPKTEELVRAYCNTSREKRDANRAYARSLGHDELLAGKPAHKRVALICCGGPSLKDTWVAARRMQRAGADLFAVNGVAGWLVQRGVNPDAQVILDARPENVAFVSRSYADRYYIAAHCAPIILDALADEQVILFDSDHIGDVGSTVGLYAMAIAALEGYRDIHVFGMDSCYRGDRHHAYEQALNEGEVVKECVLKINGRERVYRGAGWMFRQAQEYFHTARQLMDVGCSITVHGPSLIKDITHAIGGTVPPDIFPPEGSDANVDCAA